MSYVQNNGKNRLKFNNTISYPKACKHVKRQSYANTSVIYFMFKMEFLLSEDNAVCHWKFGIYPRQNKNGQ